MNRYKYKYEDLHCDYCADKKTKVCKAEYCTHIMENIAELLDEAGFLNAVENAEQCSAKYKRTMLYLKKCGVEKIRELSLLPAVAEEAIVKCEYKPKYKTCGYRGVGFICRNEQNGMCMRDWLNQIQNKN